MGIGLQCLISLASPQCYTSRADYKGQRLPGLRIQHRTLVLAVSVRIKLVLQFNAESRIRGWRMLSSILRPHMDQPTALARWVVCGEDLHVLLPYQGPECGTLLAPNWKSGFHDQYIMLKPLSTDSDSQCDTHRPEAGHGHQQAQSKLAVCLGSLGGLGIQPAI